MFKSHGNVSYLFNIPSPRHFLDNVTSILFDSSLPSKPIRNKQKKIYTHITQFQNKFQLV